MTWQPPTTEQRREAALRMRRRYRIEVRPPGGASYEVEIRTFDGPMLMGD
jgi:hypothetical protein